MTPPLRLLSILIRAWLHLARRPETWADVLARRAMGPLHRLLRKKRAANVRAFLGPRASDHRSRRLDKAHRLYQERLALEIARHAALSPADFRRLVRLEGVAHLRETLSRGRGAFIAAGHAGNWCYPSTALADAGFPVTTLVFDAPLPPVAEVFDEFTRKFGVRLCLVGQGAALAARRRLREGGVVVGLFDASIRPARSAPRPFGPAKVTADAGLARLALALGAPVLTAHAVMEAGGRCRVRLLPEAPLPAGENAAEELTRRWLSDLYGRVRRRPAQWWPLGITALPA